MHAFTSRRTSVAAIYRIVEPTKGHKQSKKKVLDKRDLNICNVDYSFKISTFTANDVCD